MIRRRIFFSGRVQGVGFRITAKQTAEQFEITGWVRNLSDGRVELLAEGSQSEVEAFLARLARIMGENILSTQQFEELATGEFHNFAVENSV